MLLPSSIVIYISIPICPQPGGNFVLGSCDCHREQKYHDHESRRFHGGCIRGDWFVNLGRPLLQPKTYCRAEEIERNRPSSIRVVPNCRRTRACRQSSRRSRNCRSDAPSATDATFAATRVARYSVFHVWALENHFLSSTNDEAAARERAGPHRCL